MRRNIFYIAIFIFVTNVVFSQEYNFNYIGDPSFENEFNFEYGWKGLWDIEYDFHYRKTGRYSMAPYIYIGEKKFNKILPTGHIVSDKLKFQLKKNNYYLISFYIHIPKKSLNQFEEFSVFLSQENNIDKYRGTLLTKPVIVDFTDNYTINDLIKIDSIWYKFCRVVKAEVNENYIVFSSYTKNKEVSIYYDKPDWRDKIKKQDIEACYYLEDTQVKLVDSDYCSCLNLSEMKIEKGDTIKLENIFFKPDKSELLKESFKELNELLEIINQNPKMKIEISGDKDNSNNETLNKKLSKTRAKTVYDFLISKGINKERITYKGYGYSKPVASNSTDEGKQKNRRVEIKIIEK